MKFYEHYIRKKETFESFIANVINKSIGTKIKPENIKDVINSDFDNIFCVRGYDVSFSPKGYAKDEEVIYEFNFHKLEKASDIEFGCELEACFNLGCRKKERPNTELGDSWETDILYHLMVNITPYLSPEFISRFPTVFIAEIYDEKYKFGYLYSFFVGKVITRYIEDLNPYNTLILTTDGSIECDDQHVQCEIVSPILSSVDDLKLLLQGIAPKSCVKVNDSTGFHINVSAVNENGGTLRLPRCTITKILSQWIKYEEKHYKTLRPSFDARSHARPLNSIINDIYGPQAISRLIKRKDEKYISDKDYFDKQGLNIWLAYQAISINKTMSVSNVKNNSILEFRMFPARTDHDTLLDYVTDTLKIFKNGLDECCELNIDLQRQYLKYEYIDTPEIPKTLIIPSNSKSNNIVNDLLHMVIYYYVYRYITTWYGLRKVEFLDLENLNNSGKNWRIFVLFPHDIHISYNINEYNGEYILTDPISSSTSECMSIMRLKYSDASDGLFSLFF